ncbi:motility protein A [Sphingomonas profundi]|uniref:motility protein A n=1 Tax=Alterirhizorhabdus profundi TaxID=2681549 RepID=UPI0012E77BFF|nr:MotA/TolQ/ExbB proton channel family protein [Sphingomonas profundi]
MDAIGQLAHFIDPVSLAIVGGGSLLAAIARSTRDDVSRAFAALGPMLRADPDADAQAAVRAVNAIEALAQVRGIACADRVETAGRFLKRAAFQLSDAASADAFALWARDELEGRRRRHDAAAGFWRAMADAGPAMGMIGTIVGLIGMFSAMDDAAAIGPAMALAMLTTLYGVILSGAIAGPIAARLERLAEAERAWQTRALDRLERLARAELASPAAIRPPLRPVLQDAA